MLASNRYILFMICITFWALFSDDSKYMIVTSNYHLIDNVFSSITLIILILYLVEICLQCYADISDEEALTVKNEYVQRYIFSFYFWLDILSTLTLLLDLTWFIDAVFNLN